MARMKRAPLSGAPCLLPRSSRTSWATVHPQMCGEILLPMSSLLRL